LTINIGAHMFDGLFTSTSPIEDKSGVYAILCQKEGKNYVVDVGESAEVRSRLDNHDRKNCWQNNCKLGTLAYAVLYTPNLQQAGRMEIEQKICAQYDPECGKT
jgi:hypothetical protein